MECGLHWWQRRGTHKRNPLPCWRIWQVSHGADQLERDGNQYPNDILNVHGNPGSYPATSGCPQIRVFGGRYYSVSLVTSCISPGDLTIVQRITVLSIAGQHKLYAAFSDFLGIIGYWTGDFQAFAVRVTS